MHSGWHQQVILVISQMSHVCADQQAVVLHRHAEQGILHGNDAGAAWHHDRAGCLAAAPPTACAPAQGHAGDHELPAGACCQQLQPGVQA